MADTPAASTPDENPGRTKHHPPLSNTDVEAIVAGFIQLCVNLIASKHLRRQAVLRNVAVSDAIAILTHGTVVGKPEWNEKDGDWSYGLRGKEIEGDELGLRIGIEADGSAIVLVTSYEPNGRMGKRANDKRLRKAVGELASHGGAMRCLECGGTTRRRRRYDYRYTESGLSNVMLNGLTVHTCTNPKCRATYPELPAAQMLPAAIAKDILAQREALRGEEVRFLRKEMGIKAKDFAEMLGVTKVAVSRWENSKRALPPITDRLIRCVFLVHRLKQRTPDEVRAFLEQFQSGLSAIQKQTRVRPTEIDVTRELASAA